MQFQLPATLNLKDYFLSLNWPKKSVFLVTLLSFVVAGGFLALAVYSAVSPSVSPEKLASGPVSPVDFFGRAVRDKIESSGGDKTVGSPLNGVLYTEAEAAVWQARRPMAVVINNHILARPQAGLSRADIVYEAVAEGGISRFVAIFHSQLPEKVGPVRSARKYFVDFAKENDAWYGHWGGASTANEANVYEYMRAIYVSSIDAMWAGAQAFWRDFSRSVPSEHTGYTSIPKLYEVAYRQYPDQRRQLDPLAAGWVFKDEAPAEDRPDAGSLTFNFWDLPDFAVEWDYDRTLNSYKRSQGGQPHLDGETNEVLTAKNVIVLFMDERSLNDGKGHLLYKTVGRGEGKAFLDGRAFDLIWVRKSVADRTRFLVVEKSARPPASSKELELNRGQIWIEVLPTGSTLYAE